MYYEWDGESAGESIWRGCVGWGVGCIGDALDNVMYRAEGASKIQVANRSF